MQEAMDGVPNSAQGLEETLTKETHLKNKPSDGMEGSDVLPMQVEEKRVDICFEVINSDNEEVWDGTVPKWQKPL